MSNTTCDYCERVCANPQGRAAHQRNCPQNPDAGKIKQASPGARQAAFVNALEQCGGEALIREMFATNKSGLGDQRAASNTLLTLSKKGVVEKTSSGAYRLTGRPLGVELDERQIAHDQQVYDAIRAAGGNGQIDQDIANKSSRPSSTRSHVLRMAKEGKLVRVSRGVYAIANGTKTRKEVVPTQLTVEVAPLVASPRLSVRDARARMQTDAAIGNALSALFRGSDAQHWTRLLEWIDLTRELLG